MIACVDVDYRGDEAAAACVLSAGWADEAPAGEIVERVVGVAPYVPGQFYKRELPCLLAVLWRVAGPIDAVVIDGYVWLHDESRPGLGAHLYEAMGKKIPVIGVAKTQFLSAQLALAVVRGALSTKPLFVTAAGMGVAEAADRVRGMHGSHRVPTLLRRVDALCRGATFAPVQG
jgi:deoxyribonuclease V